MVHKDFLSITKKYYISILMNIFMNLYDNSNIDCKKIKIKIKYMIFIIILFLINSFIVINIKIVLSLLFINRSFYY